MLAHRALVFPVTWDDPRLRWLLAEFRLLVNESIRIAVREDIRSRARLTRAAYADLSARHAVYRQYIRIGLRDDTPLDATDSLCPKLGAEANHRLFLNVVALPVHAPNEPRWGHWSWSVDETVSEGAAATTILAASSRSSEFNVRLDMWVPNSPGILGACMKGRDSARRRNWQGEACC